MTDLSRINKRFYRHPKVVKARAAEPGSISLWLLMNCWSRDHRGEGFIPAETAQEYGTEAEIRALVDSGLWLPVEGGYQFHDWADWNPDLLRRGVRTSSVWIVSQELPDHPQEVQQRLAREVEKLVDEGVALSTIKAGLAMWRQRPDAKFSWLAYFVSDALRSQSGGLRGAIAQARETLDMSGLVEYGFRWQAPDPPDDANSARAIRDFMRRQKLLWLDGIEANIGSKNTA